MIVKLPVTLVSQIILTQLLYWIEVDNPITFTRNFGEKLQKEMRGQPMKIKRHQWNNWHILFKLYPPALKSNSGPFYIHNSGKYTKPEVISRTHGMTKTWKTDFSFIQSRQSTTANILALLSQYRREAEPFGEISLSLSLYEVCIASPLGCQSINCPHLLLLEKEAD